jgi:hypothetical protein
MPAKFIPAREVKIRAIKELPGVYLKYQPVIGKIYDGVYRQSASNVASFCVIPILDKMIVLRNGEFEVIDDG